MATAKPVLDSPGKLAYYLWLSSKATEPDAIVEATREYLESWSEDSVANLQKLDAGWAPFDSHQRPQPVASGLDLRCIRDAIHAHCMALREACMRLPPELVELDEFFFVATEMLESPRRPLSVKRNPQRPSSPAGIPATPTHADNFANWS